MGTQIAATITYCTQDDQKAVILYLPECVEELLVAGGLPGHVGARCHDPTSGLVQYHQVEASVESARA